jgi:hypothetical protein
MRSGGVCSIQSAAVVRAATATFGQLSAFAATPGLSGTIRLPLNLADFGTADWERPTANKQTFALWSDNARTAVSTSAAIRAETQRSTRPPRHFAAPLSPL